MIKENNNAESNQEVVNPEGAEYNAELAEPQLNTSTETTPDDIINMSDDDFEKYINNAKNNTIPKDSSAPAVNESDDKSDTDDDTDNEPSVADEDVSKNATPNAEQTVPFKSFATEGDFENAVQERINHAFGKRFQAERKQNEQLDALYARAKHFIPGITRENLLEKLADDMYEQARNNGDDLSAMEEREALELKALRYEEQQRQIESQRKYNEQVERKRNEMLNHEQLIQLMDDDFSIRGYAEKDKAFENDLRSGKTVIEAYKAAKKRNAETAANNPPRQIKRKSITQNATTPRKGSGDVKIDPSKYSDSDFLKYIERCKKTY